MRCFVIIALTLIGTGAISAAERTDCAAGGPFCATLEISKSPFQDVEPRAEIVSGEFIIIRTAEKLNCNAGLSWMTKQAESGDSEAMFELGDMYDAGNCAPVDGAKALTWLRKAAENGNTAALGSIGRLYYLEVERDEAHYTNALLWFARGATQFDARSFYFLGLMYLQGNGVRRNDRDAFVLLDISMHLYPPLSEDRAVAFAARDRAREGLTPAEAGNAALVSNRLLDGMLEHHDEAISDLFPREALIVLRESRR
jgi:hypothetical protein